MFSSTISAVNGFSSSSTGAVAGVNKDGVDIISKQMAILEKEMAWDGWGLLSGRWVIAGYPPGRGPLGKGKGKD